MLSAQEILSEVESRLSAALKNEQSALDAPVRYAMLAAAKRVRPVLAMLSAQCFVGKLEDCHWEAALAIEMFHNFTLTHDDIMDNASLRRGQPTVAKRFGNNTAILAGDVLLIKAYQHLLHAPKHDLLQVIFDDAAIDVCCGQQLDMDYEGLTEITIEQYFDMIGGKTAALLGAACAMSAAMADVPTMAAAQMYDIGYNLGIAFQMQDDYLDAYGNTASFGKAICGDIVQGKKTCLFAYTCAALSPARKRLFLDTFNQTSLEDRKKIESIMAFYKEANAWRQVLGAVNKYFEKSMEALQKIEAEDAPKQELERFARQLLGREK